MAKYAYNAWGNCTILLDTSGLGSANPFRYRGYYYDVNLGLYYLKTRYYDPELGRFISPDDPSYLVPEILNGLNLYAYCNNNPVMNIDPNGNAWWEWVLGALAVVGIAAAVATGAAFVAGAVAGTAAASAAATGAVIGGLSLGGAELVSQGVSSNWGELDWGSLAIETVSGSVYGGLTGMMSSTTSVGLRLGLRGGLVATSGLNTALHGINQGKSFRDIMFDVGISMGLGLVSQGAMLGLDMRAGKLSASILELYAVDGGLFILKDRLMIATTSFFKNFNRNFNLREFIFS